MSATTTDRPARRRRSRRGTTALVLVALLVVGLVVATSGPPETSTPLDPDNPGREGTAALVEVLREEGVDVEVARDAAALGSAEVDGATTVVVSSTGSLGPSTVERLRRDAADGLLVLLEPEPAAASLLGVAAGRAVRVGDGVAAGCTGAAGPAGDRVGDDLRLEVDVATAYPGPGCLRTADGESLLVGDEDGAVLGAADALTNDQVLRADNAALGLRLLGGGERVVWYVPSTADLGDGDAVSLSSLLPPWLAPALWLLLLTVVAVVVWRARRLGPLATERLPVVVRAVETTRSRGRLYRRAGDRGHAAASLRTAAADRLARRLGLGAGERGAVVRAVAEATGRPADQVATLLSADAPPPTTDHELTTLAQDLDRLDREVRHP